MNALACAMHCTRQVQFGWDTTMCMNPAGHFILREPASPKSLHSVPDRRWEIRCDRCMDEDTRLRSMVFEGMAEEHTLEEYLVHQVLGS